MLTDPAMALSFEADGLPCLVAYAIAWFSVQQYQPNQKLLTENSKHSHNPFSPEETAFSKDYDLS